MLYTFGNLNVFLWIIIISLTLCSEIYHIQDRDDYFVNMCCVQSLTKIKNIYIKISCRPAQDIPKGNIKYDNTKTTR